MYKIAILGCENSHAKNFLELISAGAYPEIEVSGIYSHEPEAAAGLHDRYGVTVMSRPDELCGKVDGIMITARHGNNHYKYAKPYLAYGIPMFIDKPITCHEEDAVAFMKDAEAHKVRLCGGSTCAALPGTLSLAEAVRSGKLGNVRGGSLAAPLHSESPYGGFFFYAQHLIEVMTTIFGEKISAVQAFKKNGSLVFNADYGDFIVTGTFIENSGNYIASVYGDAALRSEALKVSSDSFRHEMDDMLDLLRGGEMKKSYESFIFPVFVMNAVIRSLDKRKTEKLSEIKL